MKIVVFGGSGLIGSPTGNLANPLHPPPPPPRKSRIAKYLAWRVFSLGCTHPLPIV